MNPIILPLFCLFLKSTQGSENNTPSPLSSLSADSSYDDVSFNFGTRETNPLINLETNDNGKSFQSHSVFNELLMPDHEVDVDDNENVNISFNSLKISESHSSSSPLLNLKFTHYDDEHYRPRGSSFHNKDSRNPRKNLQFSIGWIQYSDDHSIPSEDMVDTPENRENIHKLMIADVKHGHLEHFRFLVGLLKKLGCSFEKTRSELDFYNEESLMFAAVRSDNVEMFMEVMQYKGITFEDLNPCKLDSSRDGKKDKFSPGSYNSHKKSALDDDDEDLDEDGEEINVSIDETVFGQAIVQNSIEIVNFLLDNGIRDNFPEGSQTALHLAVEKGHKVLARTFLSRGGSQIDRPNGGLFTPLMIAIQNGHSKIVEMLLNLEASMFVLDFHRRTCLHQAVISGNLKILDIIEKQILDLSKTSRTFLFEARDMYKKTPLQYAIALNINLALNRIINQSENI